MLLGSLMWSLVAEYQNWLHVPPAGIILPLCFCVKEKAEVWTSCQTVHSQRTTFKYPWFLIEVPMKSFSGEWLCHKSGLPLTKMTWFNPRWQCELCRGVKNNFLPKTLMFFFQAFTVYLTFNTAPSKPHTPSSKDKHCLCAVIFRPLFQRCSVEFLVKELFTSMLLVYYFSFWQHYHL